MIEFETELIDILEEINGTEEKGWTNDQKVIEKNIIYILKREKLWDSKYSICFPCGAFGEIDVENGSYQYDFEIFLDLNTLIASGTCYGSGKDLSDESSEPKISTFEIEDMVLQIMDGYKRLRGVTDKEKVCFT